MTRKHSISQCIGTNVRATPIILVVLLLTTSTQVIATSEQSSMWNDARIGVTGGVLGALEISLTNETTDSEIVLNYSEMTPVVEVYTATWCLNCVTTEQALDETIGDSDVMRIHYHRHRSEPEDPFGNNATEYRWESTYGDASTVLGGCPDLLRPRCSRGRGCIWGQNRVRAASRTTTPHHWPPDLLGIS